MEPAGQARNLSESSASARWPNSRTRGLHRLAFAQTIKDPAFAIFLACAVPAMVVLPAAPLILLCAPAFMLALWRVRYLDLMDAPPAHLCAHCLYDTRGLASLVCPECGQLLPHSSSGANL